MMDGQTKGISEPTFRIRFIYKTSTESNNCNKSPSEQTYCDFTECNGQTLVSKANQSKLYKFIQPQNHKSSLFVNLTDRNTNQDDRNENHLFISPDLNKPSSISPSTNSLESTIQDLDSDSGNALDDTFLSTSTSDNFTEEDILDNCSTMSQGCNFINSFMSASRRRSASVTPQPPSAAKPAPLNEKGRRASSSDDLADLVESGTLAGNRSASGNHLAVGASTETICDTSELTQTNRTTNNGGYIQQDDLSKMQALRIETNNSHNSSDIFYTNHFDVQHPICLDDILQVDLDGLRLEEECRKLENQVQYWEQKVEELERKRFTDDVNSKFAVEKVLKQRKKLRDLEFEIYKLNLESEDSDRFSSNNLSPFNDDYDQHMNSHLYQMGVYDSRHDDHDEIVEDGFSHAVDSKIITSRFGSHIRPGQENTADILEAIPPSGALQHKQYLSKASSGTDSSEYSQLPTYDRHRHQILNNLEARSSDSNEEGDPKRNSHLSHVQNKKSNSRHTSLRRRVVEEEREKESRVRKLEAANQQYQNNLERGNHRRRPSPIRPNHFKDDFGSPHLIPKQDSSSTTTSGSPSH